MKLSGEELIGLYSFLGHKYLKGIDLKYDTRKESKDDMVHRIITSYVDKGIVDSDNRFTKAGELLLKSIDSYAKATKKVLFNQMRIAVCDEDILIVFHLIRDEKYEISAVDIHLCNKNQLLNTIIREYPDIRKAYVPGRLNEKNKLQKKEFQAQIKDFSAKEMLFLGEDSQKLVTDRIVYWNDEKCFCYYVQDEIRENIEVGSIRNMIWKLFTK